MFEELNQHRAAVAEQIQKATEIGFTGSDDLEKAHKVGDIHPNGKWVWTQLPSGRYDWRVIKKTSAPSGGSAPATAQKKNSSKEEEVKGFINILKQKPNERHFEIMDDAELKRFRDAAHRCWLDDENLNRSTRIQCKEWRDLAKQELASRAKESAGTHDFETFADNYEKEYRKKHPNETIKNSDIRQQAIKEWDKKYGKKKGEDGNDSTGGKSGEDIFNSLEDKKKKKLTKILEDESPRAYNEEDIDDVEQAIDDITDYIDSGDEPVEVLEDVKREIKGISHDKAVEVGKHLLKLERERLKTVLKKLKSSK